MSDEKLKKVKVTRTNYDHYCLKSISMNQLNQAGLEMDGYRFRWVLPAMAFSVFRVEALCNIYGSQLFPHWTHFESTSFIGKITMISDFLNIEVDFSKEPWQTVNKMKTFRNNLVHAKPDVVSCISEIPSHLPEKIAQIPESKKSIASYSSIEEAERFDKVADQLEMLWMSGCSIAGIDVDTIGVPKYEVVG